MYEKVKINFYINFFKDILFRFNILNKVKDGDKLNRKKDKQKAKEDEKLEKRRQKEEKLKKHAEKEKEREKKKQEKTKQTKGPSSTLSLSQVQQPLIEDFAQSETNRIPLFLEKCVQFIEDEGLDSEGIYRVPGNRAHVELLFQKFEEGKCFEILDLNINFFYYFMFYYCRRKRGHTFVGYTSKCCCNCFERFLLKKVTTIN